MTHTKLSRRNFISSSMYTALTLPGLAVCLNACNSSENKQKEEKPAVSADPCNDFSQVTETDLKAREKLGYVKESPIADSKCINCQLYLPQKVSPGCGKCQLFKGPVVEGGYCTYWAPQIQG
ncbi:high-potential iron-sulfur protein [Dyadobacter bucti]|jgi:hypothetical protein|uniref:high-potential iron-sulfur protein n=1 Tax=Dyadobacter bucti TaxID=2572203 RepID=UPI003F716D78